MEVETFLDRTLPAQGAGEIAFYGGTFSLLPVNRQGRYLSIARRFVESGRASGIRISTRPDGLETESVNRLKQLGITTIEIGCQSFSDSVLGSALRGHAASENVSATQRCLQAGFNVGIQLMPGLPGGDSQEALMSLQEALILGPGFVRIYPTVVIDGTELAGLWKAGHYQPWTLDETVNICADMLLHCHKSGVPVIRLGLQSDPQLEQNLLAGPYHPAFGQLVRSRIWRRAILQANSGENHLTINPHDLSDVVGHRGENRAWLSKLKPNVRVTTDASVNRGFLRISEQELPITYLSAPGGLHG